MPKDDFSRDLYGILGDIRTIVVDGVEWRVFEYRVPMQAEQPRLVFVTAGASFDADVYPADWRERPPEEIIRLVSQAQPIKQSVNRRN